MPVENLTNQGEELLSYVIASGDMRFIEINERTLFIRHDPKFGRVIHGEAPECGPECDANLSQVLLEYVMGCGDCREAELASEAADRFGQRVGWKLIENRYQEPVSEPRIETLADATTLVLNSMDVPFESDQTDAHLRFTLDYCPLRAAASKGGLNLWVAMAHRTFLALMETLAQSIAPEWPLRVPAERESDVPIREILFAKI